MPIYTIYSDCDSSVLLMNSLLKMYLHYNILLFQPSNTSLLTTLIKTEMGMHLLKKWRTIFTTTTRKWTENKSTNLLHAEIMMVIILYFEQIMFVIEVTQLSLLLEICSMYIVRVNLIKIRQITILGNVFVLWCTTRPISQTYINPNHMSLPELN